MNYAHFRIRPGMRFILITGVMILSVFPLWCQKPQSGLASYYHNSLEGNKTASGEVFRQDKFTAAHKKLPFDTWVKVTDRSGHQVVVRINDRLPAKSKRIIDLTTRAAKELEMIKKGLKRVRLRVITPREAWVWYIRNGYFLVGSR